jgi:hypothetical protein
MLALTRSAPYLTFPVNGEGTRSEQHTEARNIGRLVQVRASAPRSKFPIPASSLCFPIPDSHIPKLLFPLCNAGEGYGGGNRRSRQVSLFVTLPLEQQAARPKNTLQVRDASHTLMGATRLERTCRTR